MTNYCHHVGICTNNSQELIRFYRENLDFQEGETRPVSKDVMEHIFGIPTSCNLTKLTFGQIVLEIISPQNLPLRKWAYDIAG